jgi:type I restriction enzyme S subunit
VQKRSSQKVPDLSLPSDWTWTTLGEIGIVVRGVSYTKDEASKQPGKGLLPILRANNINGEINFDDLVFVPSSRVDEEQRVRTGDIVMAMSSGSKDLVGKAAIARADFKGGFGAFCGVFRANEKLNRFFLGLFFQTQAYRQAISSFSSGVNINNLRRQHIESIPLPLPPLPEQRAIVAKVEQLFSDLDNGIANLKKAQEQLKTYRQAVLKWAFEGRLAGEKSKWIVTTLGKIISISSGDSLPKASRNGSGKFLVYGGNGVAGRHSKYMCEEERLIIGRVGIHCGNVHMTLPKSWITDNAFLVSFDGNTLELRFLYYLLQNLNLNRYSSSTAQPVISQGRLYPIEVSYPPDRLEQQAIVQEIEARLSVCDNIEANIEDALGKSEALRQSILKKAFEGKLLSAEELEAVRRSPDWEPAEKLLERIRRQREEEEKTEERENEKRKKKKQEKRKEPAV